MCTVVGAEGFPVAGVGCVLFDNLQQEKITTDIPAEVLLTLERRDLMKEYYDLTETLFQAPKGTLGNWKSSALAQSAHIRGHDEIFEAKNVSLFVTKRAGEVGGSNIRLCVVDRTREPTFFPPDIYNPGKSVPFAHGAAFAEGCKVSPARCEELRRYLGRLPEGVYGQSFEGHRVESDKVLMPVELTKFLDKKDAVALNMDMAALINTGERTSIDAASVVRSFKSKFLAKGVRVFLGMKGLPWQHCRPQFVAGGQTCKVHESVAEWLEYADADVVGESYRPGTRGTWEYSETVVHTYDDCMSGSMSRLKASADLRATKPEWKSSCAKIAGAESRDSKKFPKCKCENDGARVYCGREAVGERKFDVDALMSSVEACRDQGMYCSARPCLAPFERVPMEP